MVDHAVAAVAALLWLTAVVEAVAVVRRDQPEPALTMLVVTFGLLAISATFFVPAVYLAAGRLTGVANIGEPIARTALAGAAWSVQVMLERLVDDEGAPRRASRRVPVLAVFVVALWVCFIVAPVDRPTRMFTRDYGDEPVVAAYLVISLGYLALGLTAVVRDTRRYARTARRTLAIALRLIGYGCLFGLAYIAVKVTFLLLLVTTHTSDASALAPALVRSLALAGALLVMAGSVLPLLASAGPRLLGPLRSYRDLRWLYPLWALMYRSTPDIAMDPTASALADALRLRDLEMRRYRRVIEIRDGRLALAPYIDPAHPSCVPDGAASPELGDRTAAVEAARLLDAAARKARGASPSRTPAPSPDKAATLADEIDWLVRVSRHLRSRSRVTRRHRPEENRSSAPTPRTNP
ncbi:MAG: hypothetical protein IPG94_21265 [Kineosporiaceae bacterium]|nr:hypothetical protein [Kineosporiaceae bacterium]